MPTKADILNADDLPTAPVEIPEWGGRFHVRTMTGVERDQFDHDLMSAKRGDQIDGRGMKARMCYLTLCDADGVRIFEEAADLVQLQEKSSAILDRVWDAASKLNGLSEQDVEELSGNSSSGPSEGSGSS